MLLRTLPLRTKLIAAMLIPLSVVTGFLGIRVADELKQRSNATEQQVEIARTQAVIHFAAAVGREGRVLASPTARTENLARQRAEVDAAWNVIVDPAMRIDADEIARLQSIADEVAALRVEVGSSPFLFRGMLSQRTTQEESGAGNAAARFARLEGNALQVLDFDRSLLSDPSQAQALNELLMVERIGANLSLEQASQLNVWSLADQPLTSGDIEALQAGQTRTNEAIASYKLLGSTAARAALQQFVSSPEFVGYQELQNVGTAAQVGDSSDIVNIAEVDRAITDVNTAFTTFESAKSTEVQARAAAAVELANDGLVRAGAIGSGLVFLVAMILFGLYQSIRQPLRRLTEQSRRVAEHDLPEIVQAIRNGDIDSVQEIETIEAYTIDEIGDLVAAINGMHRTAVDLAVEQAGSRRVVADMFVNLGRRNQKLLNRMLKGLTLLEREEEDPDKLAALYQVDHLATRMRRNAESLLILAGAPQARSWDQSVPVYDVINASLAEVENYERVDVDASEGELIKGAYVADLAHMLAELTENALAFSPPGSRVEMIAEPTRRGYAIIVNDRGIGMPADAIVAANQRIAEAGTQGETPSEFLGHFVVGRLAARNGFQVELFEGASGMSARILLPDAVFERDESLEVPNDPAELFPTRELAEVTPFATIPDSLGSDDEPFATIPDSLDIDDEPFATIPESLGFDDEPFATIPESLVYDDEPFATIPESLVYDDEPFATIPESLVYDDEPFATIPDSLDIDEITPNIDAADVSINELTDDDHATDNHVTGALDLLDIDDESSAATADPLTIEMTDDDHVAELLDAIEQHADEITVGDIDTDDMVAHSLDDDAQTTEAEIEPEIEPEVEPEVEAEAAEEQLVPLADASQPFVSPDPLPQRRPRAVIEEAAVPTPATLLATPPAGLPQRIPAPAIVRDDRDLVAANAFGVQRRKPGAQLPTTTITPRAAAIDTDLGDPDAVRSSLSGFQSGTFRADKEND